MIQHRAARFVLNKPWQKQHSDSITAMLDQLHWPTLQNRRTAARLILMFKIMRNLVTVPERCLPQLSSVSSTRARHSLKLAHIQTTANIYRFSFLPNTIQQWNNLDIKEINSIDLNTFKNIAYTHSYNSH